MTNTRERHECLSAIRKGSVAAFEALYEAESDAVYRFLARLSQDHFAARDMAQNVWLKLARHAPRLPEGTHLRGWLYTVARREFISHKRAQLLDISRLLMVGITPEAGVDPASDGGAFEVHVALGTLSDRDREVLLLTGASGLGVREAAEVLGLSEAALRQRLCRARRRFAQKLDPNRARGARIREA